MRLIATETVAGKLTEGQVYNGNFVELVTGTDKDGKIRTVSFMQVFTDEAKWEKMIPRYFVPFDYVIMQQGKADAQEKTGPALVMAHQLPPNIPKGTSTNDFLKASSPGGIREVKK